ncbi:hypothetical protein DRH29_05515, partial [candidate division Kazan bacterium]
EKILDKPGDVPRKVEDKRLIGRLAGMGVKSVESAEKALDFSAPYLSSVWSKAKTLARISMMKPIPAALHIGYRVLDWLAERKGSPELTYKAVKLAKASFLLQVLKPLDLAIIAVVLGVKKGIEVYGARRIPNLLKIARREAYDKGYPEIADLVHKGRIWRATHQARITGVELKSLELLNRKVDKLIRKIDAEVFRYVDEGVLDLKKLYALVGKISVVDEELAKKIREIVEVGDAKPYLLYRAKDEILRWSLTGKFTPSVVNYALRISDDYTKTYIKGFKEGAFTADFEKAINLAKKGLAWSSAEEFQYWRGFVDALAELYPKTLVEVGGVKLKFEELADWYSGTLRGFDFFITREEKIERVTVAVATFRVAEKPELKAVFRELGWFERLLAEGQENAWNRLFTDKTWRMLFYYLEAERVLQPEVYHEIEVARLRKKREILRELERLGEFLEEWRMPDMQVEDAIRKLGELTVYAELLNDQELIEKVKEKIEEYDYIFRGYPLKTSEAEEIMRYGLKWTELYMLIIAPREISTPLDEVSVSALKSAENMYYENMNYAKTVNSEADELMNRAQSILEDIGASNLPLPEPGFSVSLREMSKETLRDKTNKLYEVMEISEKGLWKCDEAIVALEEAERYARIAGDKEKLKAVEEFKVQVMAKRQLFEKLLKWASAWIGQLEGVLE